jgi:hypothetical protein
MSELEGPVGTEGGRLVAKASQWRQLLIVGASLAMCAFVLAPPSAIGTTILAGGAAVMIRFFRKDIPAMLEHDKVRPEVVAVGSVAATLYIYELVVDNALLPLSLEVLSEPLMALAVGTLAVLTAAIPTFAVSVWRFWQREML